MKYILWDWNGTLLNDTWICCHALNMMLSSRGLPEIGLGYFRDNFAFPSRNFYGKLGMKIADSEWNGIAAEYHRNYAQNAATLADDAIAALDAAKDAGFAQAIISAHRQDLLEKECDALGVSSYMEFIYGTDNLYGGTKIERGKALMRNIRKCHGDIDGVVLVGDSLHDLEVARAMEVECILYSGGSHSRNRLAATGERVADSLLEAVRSAK